MSAPGDGEPQPVPARDLEGATSIVLSLTWAPALPPTLPMPPDLRGLFLVGKRGFAPY
ncbi:hypothetical protein Srubr_25660 [Streptomyces rubradiris]|uniref:Uncharacterized protein n=1 Tax=Streptomyces rubradiris TaxID=285531 RepID=A0ABQ3RA39_STRRR|nr:hypothetical protein GCM10018792_65150 [Streptomyces rubradiris]GHI52720.1 hypothetical protein Srubr_25660 [Streptomyces rubradiris]